MYQGRSRRGMSKISRWLVAIAAGALALIGILLLVWLQPGMGDLRIPATIYNGVIVVMAVTFGMICPPVGMNVFVINSIARDIPLTRIYAGTMPFIAVDLVRLVVLCAFPGIALWLPQVLGL